MTVLPMQSIKALVNDVDFAGESFISINSMSNDQLLALFTLGKNLELMNRDRWDLYPGAIETLLFFQPSTRTRMSFRPRCSDWVGTSSSRLARRRVLPLRRRNRSTT